MFTHIIARMHRLTRMNCFGPQCGPAVASRLSWRLLLSGLTNSRATVGSNNVPHTSAKLRIGGREHMVDQWVLQFLFEALQLPSLKDTTKSVVVITRIPGLPSWTVPCTQGSKAGCFRIARGKSCLLQCGTQDIKNILSNQDLSFLVLSGDQPKPAAVFSGELVATGNTRLPSQDDYDVCSYH